MIRQYIISLLVAAIVCGIISTMVGSKSNNAVIIKMLSGIFMTITMISPIIQFEFDSLSTYLDGLSMDASSAVAYGESLAEESMASIIKEQTETYILDKAAFLELNLKVEVTLSKSNPPVPETVSLKGSASPHAKRQLTKYIANELGISEENQKWI